MDRSELVEFVRARGLAVIATCGEDGRPEAALVGVAATDRGELVFDTTRASRKFANLERTADIAVVVGWDDEVTVQIEGSADVLDGSELVRCQQAYFDQYPDGRERAKSAEIVLIRVRPAWIRHSDYRPDSFAISETTL